MSEIAWICLQARLVCLPRKQLAAHARPLSEPGSFCRWRWKLQDRELVRQSICECQSLLKNQRKLRKVCRLAANQYDDSESESSASEAQSFGIKEFMEGDIQKPDEAAPYDDVMPLWTFDPEQAPPGDVEDCSEVHTQKPAQIPGFKP